MPSIHDKPNVAAAQVLGKQLVADSSTQTIAQLKDAYAGFRAALASPELKAEMDKFLVGADPQLAGLVGADKAAGQFDAQKASEAVWGKFFARDDARKALFTEVFGAQTAQTPGARMEAHQSGPAVDGKLPYDVSMWVKADSGMGGLDVLRVNTIAQAKLFIDPSDMSWTKVAAPAAAAAPAPLDHTALKNAVWQKYFAKDDDRLAFFEAAFGKPLIDQVPPRWRHLMSTGVEEFKDGKLAMHVSVSVKDESAPRTAFDVLITKRLAEATVEFHQDLSWNKV
jgi:hypothetical protein